MLHCYHRLTYSSVTASGLEKPRSGLEKPSFWKKFLGFIVFFGNDVVLENKAPRGVPKQSWSWSWEKKSQKKAWEFQDLLLTITIKYFDWHRVAYFVTSNYVHCDSVFHKNVTVLVFVIVRCQNWSRLKYEIKFHLYYKMCNKSKI